MGGCSFLSNYYKLLVSWYLQLYLTLNGVKKQWLTYNYYQRHINIIIYLVMNRISNASGVWSMA